MAALATLCVALAGCGSQDPDSPDPDPSARSGPAPTPPVLATLTGRGVGPYVVGAGLDALGAADALANVKTSKGCPDFTTADAGGPYFGTVTIVFFKKKISWITISSALVSTVEGARVGLTMAGVKRIYGAKANQLNDGRGATALGVRDGTGTGLIFRAESDGTVGSIDAGTYDTLEARFVEGEGC
jgi:hypothetical protein